MSFSIFLFAVLEAFSAFIFYAVVYDFRRTKSSCYVMGASIIFVLCTLFLSFNFENFHHLMASVKYDHVLPVTYYEDGEKPQCMIDQEKVIYYDSYKLGNGKTAHFALMAWNDKKSYDELIKYNSIKDIQ